MTTGVSPRDNDLFAGFYAANEFGEVGLCLVNGERCHGAGSRLAKLANLCEAGREVKDGSQFAAILRGLF